jgi:hypothetical protein
MEASRRAVIHYWESTERCLDIGDPQVSERVTASSGHRMPRRAHSSRTFPADGLIKRARQGEFDIDAVLGPHRAIFDRLHRCYPLKIFIRYLFLVPTS